MRERESKEEKEKKKYEKEAIGSRNVSGDDAGTYGVRHDCVI